MYIGIGQKLFNGTAISPMSLFAAGEEGFWLDCNDWEQTWRKNLACNTEDFASVTYTKTNATITANDTTSPIGTSADRMTATASFALCQQVLPFGNALVGQTYTVSMWLKRRTGTGQIFLRGVENINTPISVTSDWQRFSVTATATTTTVRCGIMIAISGDEVWVWGAQIERGSTMTDYQPILYDNQGAVPNNITPTLIRPSPFQSPNEPEQSVALVLDKSKGLVRGPELQTNGDFSNGLVGYNVVHSASVSSGVCTTTTVAGNANTYMLGAPSFSCSVGDVFELTADIRGLTGPEWQCRINVDNAAVTIFYAQSQFNVKPDWQTVRCIFAATDVTVKAHFARNSSSTTGGFQYQIRNISCKKIAGNHAYQTTTTQRPLLRARYNLVTFSEQFDNAAWTKSSCSITTNATTAPDGIVSADKLVEDNLNFQHRVYLTTNIGTISGQPYRVSIYAKAAERSWIALRFDTLANSTVWLDLSTGTLGTVQSAITATNVTNVGNGWYRLELTALAGGATLGIECWSALGNNGSAYLGDGISGLFIWGAQFTSVNTFPSNAYQRIEGSNVYAIGPSFPAYLNFDGSDDGLRTNTINFSATDEVTILAGVGKQSETAGIIAELSDSSAPSGVWLFDNSSGGGTNYRFLSRGTAIAQANANSLAAPRNDVLSMFSKISTDNLAIRSKGVQVGTSTSDQGTGNFGSYPVFIGRRGGTSSPFNGRMYQLIVRGKVSTTSELQQTEYFIGQKVPTGVL